MTVLRRIFDQQIVPQRITDGYINGTAMCQATDKLIGDYLRNKTTIAFLEALSSDMGIPISELIQIQKGGTPELQGTWVHFDVAINLAQWASPDFAVQVVRWVREWLTGSIKHNYQQPYHLRRYAINRHKIPHTHFSILDQMCIQFLGSMEFKGYILPKELMPDISLGKMFSKELKAQGYDIDLFPTYTHEFDDGHRPPVQARLYPNELLTSCKQMIDVWMKEKAPAYFKKKDPTALPLLTQLIEGDVKPLIFERYPK